MPVFIKLSNTQRKLFFNELKEKINTSWEKFYPLFNTSRTMFFNYLSGRYAIPKNLFDKWQRISKTNFKGMPKEIEKPKYLWKPLNLIKMDSKLAEIFGVLNGDGHISNFKYEICVVGDTREKNYLNYLKTLFEGKFKIQFNFFEEPTRIKLRTYSIELSNLLTKNYGLPKGNKLGKLKIPRQVLHYRKWIISYIRGLFDTDGSIYQRRKKDLVVNIRSADMRFINEVKGALSELGFHSSLSKGNLNLYRQEEVARFFRIIKPANPKHLKNFENYSNKARVV